MCQFAFLKPLYYLANIDIFMKYTNDLSLNFADIFIVNMDTVSSAIFNFFCYGCVIVFLLTKEHKFIRFCMSNELSCNVLCYLFFSL